MKPENFILIGDTVQDFEAARIMSVDFIALRKGQMFPQHVSCFESMHEIRKYIISHYKMNIK